jgi:hypothetical protein
MSTSKEFNFLEHAKSDTSTDKPIDKKQKTEPRLIDLIRAKLKNNPL